MSVVELDYPTSRHLRSGDGIIPGRPFIVGDISANADPLSEGRNFNKRDVGLTLGGALMLGGTILGLPGCGQQAIGSPSETSTPTERVITQTRSEITSPIDNQTTIESELVYPLSHTIYLSEDQGLSPEAKFLHQRNIILARQIIERVKLDFLIHQVVTVEPKDELPLLIKKMLGPFTKIAVHRGFVNFYPEGVKMSLNPYLNSEESGRRTVNHELGHSIDPDLNLYLANFISPTDLLALQRATTKLKDIYWQYYFPDDQRTISPVEQYYRKKYTDEVGQRFGGSEDLGKRLMIAYLQNPHQFDGWSQEDLDFLRERIKFLGGEFLAENVANFVIKPFESTQNFPNLTKRSFELGAILDLITQHK